MTDIDESVVNVCYLVDDVAAAVDFYTTHFDFTLRSAQLPAFADIACGRLRSLPAGPTRSAGRPMPDGRQLGPGGWNRFPPIVDDIAVEVVRLSTAGVSLRGDIITGPGGRQIVLDEPSGNPLELFTPAAQ